LMSVFLFVLFFVALLSVSALEGHSEEHVATAGRTDKATTNAAELAAGEHRPSGSSWKSWYRKATHLLDSMPSSSILDPKPKQKADEITQQIRMLSKVLLKEEEKLAELIVIRDALKVGWFWFLDPQIRAAVDEATFKVNVQRRLVEALYEEIALHWKQLKPLYGVFSKMFLAELLAFLVAPILSFLELFVSAFSLGLLLFLLLLGPPAFFVSMFAFSVGVALIPILGGALLITWLIEFPWLVLQYNPSFGAFVITFSPFVLATIALALHMGRTLRRADVPLMPVERPPARIKKDD